MRSFAILLFGGLCGWVVSLLYFADFRDAFTTLFVSNWSTLLIATIAVPLIGLFAVWLFKRWMRRTFNAKELTESALADFIAKILARPSTDPQAKAIKQLAASAFTYWSTAHAYRWVFAATFAIASALAGGFGTILLMKQNEKLDQQILVAKQMASLSEIQLLKAKSDELESINELTNEISRALTPQMQAEIEKYYGGKDGFRCFPDQRESATAPRKTTTPFPWKQKTRQLKIRVASFIDGTLDDSDKHKKQRGNLFEILASSGIPFVAFKGTNYDNVELPHGTLLEKGNLSSASFYKSRIAGLVAAYVCASRLKITDSEVSSADFSNSTLHDSWFWEAKLVKADFREASFVNTLTRTNDYTADSWRDAGWVDYPDASGSNDLTKFSTYTRWIASFFRSIRNMFELWGQEHNADYYYIGGGDIPVGFWQSDVSEANFASAKITAISFFNAKLTSASFAHAIIKPGPVPTSFASATLTNADFRVAPSSDLDKITFSGTDLTNTIVDGLDFGANKTLKKSQLLKACICDGPMPKLHGATVPLKRCKDNRYCKPPKS